MTRLRDLIDPYILALLGTVLLASLLPVQGGAAAIFDILADAAVVLLFFLHGAKLSREAILSGAGNWRLHLAVLGTTFALFPALGWGIAAIPGLPPVVASGMLFLTLLPSTVQSSIAFTSIARGNVAAAVCSASFSNLIGIFITPALVALLMSKAGTGGGFSFSSVEKILLQLLLPFVLGHLLRPLIGGFVSRHKSLVTYVDRGSILLIVYTAFSAAVVEGLWRQMPLTSLAIVLALCVLLLAIILVFTWRFGALIGLDRADRIVLLFCGSKKSLASGVPMAGALFPAALVGQVILPLMLFHQIQLIACAFLARRLAADAPE
jgi:sodium/bile acid cotransporter 7